MILPVILLLMGFCSIRVGASQSVEFFLCKLIGQYFYRMKKSFPGLVKALELGQL